MRILLLVGLLVGCGSPPPAECTYNTDCGEQAVCEDGTCRTVECLTTQDCTFASYCSDAFVCESGCGIDLDCPAGSTCEDNTCEEYGCRSTDLDCGLGEFCEDGTCKTDDRGHCELCNIENANACGNSGECVYYSGATCGNNNDCDPGYKCENRGVGKTCVLDVCIIECNPNAALDCPRGLDCVQALTSSNKYYCAGDCPYLIEEGAF